MKVNFTVFLLCGGFIIVFVCFILIAFHQSVKNSLSEHETHNSDSDDLTTTTSSILTKEEVLLLPPCRSFGGRLWLHHVSGECYEVGTQGPCGESMTFYQHPQKSLRTIGFCDCDDIVEVKSHIPECEVIQRPLIYYPDDKTCYSVFSQGPCSNDMWLVLSDHGKPACEPNICKSNHGALGNEEDSFWFSEFGKCYRSQTKGYCKFGYVLNVVKTNWKPECRKDIHDDCIVAEEVSIVSLQCRPGNRLDSLNKCPPIPQINETVITKERENL